VLAIIVPIFNEEKGIYNFLRDWELILKKSKIKYCFYLVNDCSTDFTKLKIYKYIQNRKNFILIDLKKNVGHGKSCLIGFKAAYKNQHNWYLQIDSDGQCHPKYLNSFLQYMRSDVEFVIADRVIRFDGYIRRFISRILSLVILLLTGIYTRDANAPYRLINIKAFDLIVFDQTYNKIFLTNVYLTYFFIKNLSKYKIKWIDISFYKRKFGKSKISYKKMFEQLVDLIKNLSLKN
jgi:hypothetical protein